MSKARGNYYRLYLSQTLSSGSNIVLSQEDGHYLAGVLRIRHGGIIKVFNQQYGEFWAKVLIEKKQTSVFIQGFIRPSTTASYLHLGFCMVKPGIMPDIIDAAVQLGVSHITPLISAYTNNREFNLARYKKIAKEALEQSGRCDFVEVLEPIDLQGFVSKKFDLIIWANEKEAEAKLLGIKKWPEKLAVIIGPEGGFSQDEVGYLSAIAYSTSLNRNILKTQTACSCILSQISLLRQQ